MSDQRHPLGPHPNGLEPLARADNEPRAAILKPIRPVLIIEAHKMIIGPGWRPGAVADTGEVLLVEVGVPRKGTIAIENHVAVCIGLPLQQPGKDMAVGAVFDPAVLTRAELQEGAIGQGALPMVAHWLIPDERPLVLAEEVAVGLRNQLLLHFVDERVRPGKAHVLAIGRNAMVAAPLHIRNGQAPAIAQGTVAPASLVTQAQGRHVPRRSGRQLEPNAVLSRAGVERGLK